MDKTFEERMRRALLARRAKIAGNDRDLGADEQALLDDDKTDLVDHAQGAAASEVVLNLDDKDRQQLGEIDAALERLAEGQYGVCAECEEEIPRGRLEVLPEARACAACAEGPARQVQPAP